MKLSLIKRSQTNGKSLKHKLKMKPNAKPQKQFSGQIAKLQEQIAEQNKAAEDAKKQIAKVQVDAKAKALEEFELEKKSLADELAEKEEKLKAFREQELDLRKQRKALEESQDNLKLEIQRQLDAERQKLTAEISHKESNRFLMMEAEYKRKRLKMHRKLMKTCGASWNKDHSSCRVKYLNLKSSTR